MNEKEAWLNQERLGQRLQTQRESLGFSLRDIAQTLSTSSRLVKAIEEGNYKELTAKVYARGFIQRLFVVLQLADESAFLLHQFDREWEIFKKDNEKKVFSYEPITFLPKRLHLTPMHIRRGIILFGLFSLLSFFGSRLFYFLGDPSLVIHEPKEEETKKEEPIVRVSGKGEKESRLTVNGRELTMSEEGNFNDTIELRPGLNELEFTLENRFGKLAKEVRYVLVQ